MKGKGQGVLKSGSSPVGKSGKLKDISSVLELERQSLKNIAQQIKQSLYDMPELRGLMEHVEIEVIREGLRIQLIDSDKDAKANFFDLGSAKLKPRTSLLLTAIAKELGYLPNFIVIEGHTDSKPFSGIDGYSNWELSADRANSARKLMENAGLRAGQIVEVRGYADRMPRLPERPGDPRNRRVAIIALNEEAAKRFSQI
jgi:chemotaxis protein MotB